MNDREIPAPLRRICLKAMAADPAGRHASAEAFENALERHLQSPKVRAAVAGVAGLALFGILGRLAVTHWMPPSIVPPAPSATPIPQPAHPMKSRIDLLVVKSKDGTRRRLRLEDRGSVPVRADDEIRIEARLNRPAYLHLFWVGSDAKVAPTFPWQPGHWETRPAQEQKRDHLDLPERAEAAWEIPAGRPGIETLLQLVREESPLPRKDEETIARLLAGARVSTDILIEEAVWLENGREGTIDLHDRAAPSTETRKSDDPVLRIRWLLSQQVRPLGDYQQAIVFPKQGGTSGTTARGCHNR